MDYEIINCYELDVRQDIPTEMEALIAENSEIKNKNKTLTYIMLAIGIGAVIWSLVQSSRMEKRRRERAGN